MDIWFPQLHFATWILVNLPVVFALTLTVMETDLKPCEKDNQTCVTDLRDCEPPPPSAIQKNLNLSCHYQMSNKSVTCEWSDESETHTEPDVSLIFRRKNHILFCTRSFGPLAQLSITVRMKHYENAKEIWSQPHTVFLYKVVKPSQPVLTVLDSAADSVNVSWGSSSHGRCRLRYRANSTYMWTQAADSVAAEKDQILTYKIQDLLPFTGYRAAVACIGASGIWSDWSSEVAVRTLDRVPSRPVEVCYRLEKTASGGFFPLHLTWKDLNLCDPGGHILGYQVSYKLLGKEDMVIEHVAEVAALLLVKEGNYTVTVRAFNSAGYGPAVHLNIDIRRQNALPSVRNLWVSSLFPATKDLQVQWKNPSDLAPVSYFAIQWRSDRRPPTGCWTTVDNFTTSTLIQDVDPGESYQISVFPVYKQQCGSPQSLNASLQHGAMMEAVKLKVLDKSKTTLTVEWEWQNKSEPIRVNEYRVALSKHTEIKTLSLWPDQRQHTFNNLRPNTKYKVFLMADNVTRHTISVTTSFDCAPVVAAVTLVLLLAAALFTISILSRTLYKSYFFPPITSPGLSSTGQWLMDPNHQKTTERHILDVEEFRVTDVLGQKSIIAACPISKQSSEGDKREEASRLVLSHLTVKPSSLWVDTEYICDISVITEHQHPDYALNWHHPDGQTLPDNYRFRHLEAKGSECDFPESSHLKEIIEKFNICEFVANTNSNMTCETDYISLQNI